MTFIELLYPPPDSVWTPAQPPPGQFRMDTLWQTNMTMEATQFSYIVRYVYKWSMCLCHVCVPVSKLCLCVHSFLVVFPTSFLASKCWKAEGQNNRLLFYLESTSIPMDITTKVNVCFPYMQIHGTAFSQICWRSKCKSKTISEHYRSKPLFRVTLAEVVVNWPRLPARPTGNAPPHGMVPHTHLVMALPVLL